MWDIVIVGAGGFAREVATLLPGFLPSVPFRLKGFLGKDTGVATDCPLPAPLLGDPETYQPTATDRLVLAIGDMRARRRIVESLRAQQAVFPTLVHAQALVAPTAELAAGVIVYPFAVVSNRARLESCVKLNYYASVGHDTRLGAYCLLAPYATVNGFGILEDEVYMSTHATVAPQVHVGARSKISANSAAMRDVPADQLVFGVPGKVAPQWS